MTHRRASIGLCMIVRDEAAVIGRCLASVRPLIDHWVICDTGSADGTQQLVADALAGVPGTLAERPWRDFGHNRTELMALASGTADYLLLLDADMTLRHTAPLPDLHADAYLLRHSGDLEYWVPRLVRGDRCWRFEGSTHEYLTSEAPISEEQLEGLVIDHHADGGRRGEKLDRDRRLLRAHLDNKPDDARATFYLAQTLRDLGDDVAAAELYRKRAGMEGWDEETYYAAFQAGALLARSDVEAGIAALEEAVRVRPSRGEALHELARVHRFLGHHEKARALAERGAALPHPHDRLFVHRDIHDWGFRFEQAMAAHMAGRPAEALTLADGLLDEGRLPPEVAHALRESRAYFITALGDRARPLPAQLLISIAPSFVTGEIALTVDPPWPQLNPTVAAAGGGFHAVVRTVNYHLIDGGYSVFSADGVVRTINYLLRLDRDLAVRVVAPVAEPQDGPRVYPSPVEGFEDLRLVDVGGRWFATAAARDRNPGAMAETALLELADDGAIVRAQILSGPDPARDEKNWMPFADDGRLLLVYSASPTVVLECDVDTGALTTVSERPAPGWAAGLRGGSQGVPVDGGHLFVVHEVISEADPRVYVHRFILLDTDHRLAAASPRFTFTGAEIEMCLGLAPRGDELVISFGVDDAMARIGVLRVTEAIDSLVAAH